MIVCIEKVTIYDDISGLTSNLTLIFPRWWNPKTNLTLPTPSPSSCCPGGLTMKNLSLVFQKCLESEISSARPSLSELNSLLEKEGVDLEVEERRWKSNKPQKSLSPELLATYMVTYQLTVSIFFTKKENNLQPTRVAAPWKSPFKKACS